MDYEKLKEVIANKIKENGKGEITGPILQAVLMAMVDSLGEVYPQNYTEEEKARARANIDALSNYDGEITEEKLSAEVQAILADVPNKQDIEDATLATIAKTIVGAINELYNGGVKNKAITADKIADYSIRMDKLTMAGRQYPDLGLSVYHRLVITLTGEGNTGSITLVSNGATFSDDNDVYDKLETLIAILGQGITLVVTEPVPGNPLGKRYLGTVVSVNNNVGELTAIVNESLANRDYFVVIKDFQFITKICLTDQLPKITSLETDVTTLQGLINTKVKIINENTDLNVLTEDGLYLLSAGHTYTNYPSSDGATGSASYLNNAAFLIVSRRLMETNISQVVLSVSNTMLLPLARRRYYDGSKWFVWNDDKMYDEIWRGVNNSVKYQDLSALTDTEINTIWNNN